jgi:hypothetical protein
MLTEMFFCSYFVQWGGVLRGLKGLKGFWFLVSVSRISGSSVQCSRVQCSRVQKFKVQGFKSSRVQKFGRFEHFGFALGIWTLEFEIWNLELGPQFT